MYLVVGVGIRAIPVVIDQEIGPVERMRSSKKSSSVSRFMRALWPNRGGRHASTIQVDRAGGERPRGVDGRLRGTRTEPEAPPEETPPASATAAPPRTELPPAAETALERLNTSPRHGEWVDVAVPGRDVPLNTWVVYPERADNAPVVLVIHEIFGLTDWVRGVADQLAADGFIAVAPDLLSGKGPGVGGTEAFGSRDDAVAAIRALDPAERTAGLDATRSFALSIPAASGRLGVVGFCWGGMSSFAYAVSQSDLDAAVVYYGTSPTEPGEYARIAAPILGHYGGDDARVNATVPGASEALSGAAQSFAPFFYEGAGHGFLRAQSDREGANLRATQQAWPRTVAFFREHLER